jgi:hypothetical protein
MKLLILTACLGALGLGSYQLSNDTVAAKAAAKIAGDCQASVQCTPEGNCLIRCSNVEGEECTIELDCDGGSCRVVSCDAPAGGCSPCDK